MNGRTKVRPYKFPRVTRKPETAFDSKMDLVWSRKGNRMWADEAFPQRRSLRLRDYDYTSAGAYFVTICVANRACFLGEIVDSVMHLAPLGRIVAEMWLALPGRFPVVDLDAFIAMPNHFHRIIVLNEFQIPNVPTRVGAKQAPPAAKQPELQNKGGADITSRTSSATTAAPSLSRVIQAFKSISAIACNRVSGREGQPFWQRGYYDHVIRDEHELNQIRAYIASNPARWTEDSEYPIGDW